MAETGCENNISNREIYQQKKRFLVTVNQNIWVVISSGIYRKRRPVTLAQYTFRCKQNNTLDWHMDTQIKSYTK